MVLPRKQPPQLLVLAATNCVQQRATWAGTRSSSNLSKADERYNFNAVMGSFSACKRQVTECRVHRGGRNMYHGVTNMHSWYWPQEMTSSAYESLSIHKVSCTPWTRCVHNRVASQLFMLLKRPATFERNSRCEKFANMHPQDTNMLQ
jgi:hypothetical protein